MTPSRLTTGRARLDRDVDVPLRNPLALLARLDVGGSSLLLVDAPESLERLLVRSRAPESAPVTIAANAIRSVKEDFDAILLWREDRVGSQALLEGLSKRLRPTGAIWVVTAMRKVSGPRTPGARRLERRDLEKAFAKAGLACDREARFSAWHVGYRFTRPAEGAYSM